MKKITQTFCFILLFFTLGGWGPMTWFYPAITVPIGSKAWWNQEMNKIKAQAENLNPTVLKMSLQAYLHARRHGITHKDTLTIIDYSKTSDRRRLWVINLKNAKVLFNTWVTHGRNSGKIAPTSFSNVEGSLKSSLGVFLTSISPYVGRNGYSLRLIGLENGINDNALERHIVFHGAWYAHPKVIKQHGFLGRSWGCPAVSEATIRPLINTIKDKTLVFVYYPEQHWLKHSSFLAGSSGRTIL